MARSKSQRAQGASSEMSQLIDAGANKIKKRIRDLERLLVKKKDILPHTVLIEKERTLEALKLELENARVKQVAKKNAKKYHMVRFFERKKALRRYKQALKNYQDSNQDRDLQSKLLEKKIDLCYVVNFPKTEKYIALYPSTDDSDSKSDATQSKREMFRKLVAKQLKEGTLPISFEEIMQGKKLDRNITGLKTENAKVEKPTKESSDDEEQDDFFE